MGVLKADHDFLRIWVNFGRSRQKLRIFIGKMTAVILSQHDGAPYLNGTRPHI